jgi:hypothetical protein
MFIFDLTGKVKSRGRESGVRIGVSKSGVRIGVRIEGEMRKKCQLKNGIIIDLREKITRVRKG